MKRIMCGFSSHLHRGSLNEVTLVWTCPCGSHTYTDEWLWAAWHGRWERAQGSVAWSGGEAA